MKKNIGNAMALYEYLKTGEVLGKCMKLNEA